MAVAYHVISDARRAAAKASEAAASASARASEAEGVLRDRDRELGEAVRHPHTPHASRASRLPSRIFA